MLSKEENKITNIETLIINRRREKNCKCIKPRYEIDTQNHLVYCQDCMAVVEPFEALIQIAMHLENINYKIECATRYKQELMNYKPHLREAKRYERMMREKDMLPLCPRCKKPFFWNEVTEMTNKHFYKEVTNDRL